MSRKILRKLSSMGKTNNDKYLYNNYGDYRDSQSTQSSLLADGPAPVNTINHKSSSKGPTFRNVVYFCSWSIYARDHFPEDLPVEALTHVIYAFLNVDPSTGAVILDDEWASTGTNATRAGKQQVGDGIFGELYRLKEKNRNLKVLVSVGGWTYSAAVRTMMNDAQKRKTAIDSLIQMIRQYCFDGVDLDWEYPENTLEATNYLAMTVDLRTALNDLATELHLPVSQFEISVAAPSGPDQRKVFDIRSMSSYIDFWNLMSYDFAGAWSESVGHQSNLYHGYISVSNATDYYLHQGARSHQLVVGFPVYGRSFANTRGLNDTFRGVGKGTWEDGIVDYKNLPLPNTQEHVDSTSVGAFCFDPSHRCFVTYDNPETVRIKAEYVRNMRLGGAMWWESSADLPFSNPRSLIGKFYRAIGGRLNMKPNYVRG